MKQNTFKVTTANDLRRLLADVINELKNGRMEVRVAATIGNLCNTQLKIIQAVDFESRITKLENGEYIENESNPITSDIKSRISELRN